ncbi:MAG TPA: DUF4394 domain-containing protein, partial [Pyrinomonadaceae bacterium]|nr:DUF4394 domain-containing protein [Pyrinomonadaceae bacterium]
MKKKLPLTFWRPLILILLLLPAVMVWLKPPTQLQSKLDTVVHAASFSVTNNNDDGPGSLRAAIINSNLNPSPNASQNFVVFLIPGGQQTIKLLSPLPVITSPLFINGANNAIPVELDGSSAGPGANGLTINSSRCDVYSFVINRFDGAGISIIGGENATVSSNRIGTDRSVTLDLGNKRAGIEIKNSNRNQISVNVISRNHGSGIEIHDSANNSIYANNITGSTLSGIFIGGAAATANNIYSNQIGVNNIGPLGNQTGITIDPAAAANIISTNFIAGNTGDGILVEGNDNVIQNNQIGGSTFDASLEIGNGHDGILIRNGARNLIGGIPFGVGNYLIWNGANGLEVTGAAAAANKIFNNHIGLDITHARHCPNGADGIHFSSGANSNVVGNPELGSYTENHIAFNHGAGVRVDIDAGIGNTIVGNAIRENDGLGIDLGAAGITPNDSGDVDSGGNGLQNFPLLTVARSATGGTFFTFNRGYIEGTLNSTPGSAFRLDFFNNQSCDSSGNGEGKSFLGSTTASTSADGNAVFSVSNLPFFPDALITATATDQNGSTSEFSPCIPTQNAGAILFDSDDRPHFQAVKESAGNVIITLVRQGGAAGNVSVDYATVNETATAGADYVAASGTINFADGESSKSFSIPIINDNLTEGFETFGVRLSNPTGGAGYGYLSLIVVIEDNAAPSRNLYTLTSENDLVKSTTAHPEVALSSVHLAGEPIFKIDFRPATGQLYGISQGGRLFVIDKNTGAMTQVGTAPIPSFTHYPVGFDFNPVMDRIRLLLADGRNLQVNPDTGVVTSTDGPLAFAALDLNAGQLPHITEIANSNDYSGATSTTTYALNVPNFFDTQLLTLGSFNGTPIPPASGQLFTIGGFAGVSFYGFDIVDDQAFTSGDYQEDNVTQGAPGLFRIDLATRVATRIGNAVSAGDVAIEPPQQIQFSAALYSVNENAGAATITVIRNGDKSGTVSVNYSTGDNTAVAGLDYSAS